MTASAILVTGGAGFIGTHLVRHLLADEQTAVVNLDALTYAGGLTLPDDLAKHPRHHFVEGNILNSRLVTALLQQFKPRAIIHCAAESHVDRSIDAPGVFLQTNVVGTQRMLECAWHYWQDLPADARATFRFVHISTDEVFGDAYPDRFFTETSPYDPRSPYAASKAASDHFVMAYGTTYHLPVLISHCSNNYGTYQFPEKLIPRTIVRALAGEALPLYGDGLQERDWIHVDDHCRAVLAMLERAPIGTQYIVGAGYPRTNRAIVEHICAALDQLQPRADGQSYATQIALVTDRPGHDRRYAVDAGKARQVLGWTPHVGFAAGMRDTVAWYVEHAEWTGRIDLRSHQQRLGLRGATE